MDKKFCDLCHKEIKEFNRVFFISYGEKKEGLASFMSNKKSKNGEICEKCIEEIDTFVQGLKGK